MHEVITISVGQAGNQVAWRFWDLVSREAAAQGTKGVYDSGTSTFFENFHDGEPPSASGRIGGGLRGSPSVSALFGDAPLASLRARALLIDLEEGVVSQVLRAPGGLGRLFDPAQALVDVSGAGNNWACGYHGYGSVHRSALLTRLHRALEACESPQSFFFLSSTGGGTGSGFGSFVLETCADEYPELFRFAAPIFPSENDDVVTSPYNFAFAFDKLVAHADAVLPLENQALHAVVAACEDGLRKLSGTRTVGAGAGTAAAAARAASLLHIEYGPLPLLPAMLQAAAAPRPLARAAPTAGGGLARSLAAADAALARAAGGGTASRPLASTATSAATAEVPRRRRGTAFDSMNNLAAHLLCNLTASMRFEGPLNVDLNEITSCLVPFPRMHLLQSAVAPLFIAPDAAASYGTSRVVDAMFSSAFNADSQLLRGDPHAAVHMACGLLARGPVPLSDVTRNVERLKKELTMARWNPDGFKIGICAAPPEHAPQALLSLSNNTSIVATLQAAHGRFTRLLRARAHVHHYTDFMDESHFADAGATLQDTIAAYAEVARE